MCDSSPNVFLFVVEANKFWMMHVAYDFPFQFDMCSVV